jgi:hypothetical protein
VIVSHIKKRIISLQPKRLVNLKIEQQGFHKQDFLQQVIKQVLRFIAIFFIPTFAGIAKITL